jgi:LacI family transcriptional regulator
MQSLKIIPNVIGLNLKTENKTIGLLYLIFLIFFAKVLAVSKRQMKRYNVIMCISNESMDKEATLRNVE